MAFTGYLWHLGGIHVRMSGVRAEYYIESGTKGGDVFACRWNRFHVSVVAEHRKQLFPLSQ